MTTITRFDFSVKPEQGIPGLVMIEMACIPTHQGEVFALVFVVALETFVRFSAMEPSLRTDPLRKLFVTR